MKTTIDIPQKTLQEAVKYTHAKTKKEAVVKALEEFNRRQRLAKLANKLGTFDRFISREELRKMRETA